MKLYRYSAKYTAWVDEYDNANLNFPAIELSEYKVIKETNKTWRITHDWDGFQSSWSTVVRKNSRKKFAYPTKKAAAQSFLLRKNRQVEILTKQLLNAKYEQVLAENLMEEFNKNENTAEVLKKYFKE